jgi:hypothetical protein
MPTIISTSKSQALAKQSSFTDAFQEAPSSDAASHEISIHGEYHHLPSSSSQVDSDFESPKLPAATLEVIERISWRMYNKLGESWVVFAGAGLAVFGCACFEGLLLCRRPNYSFALRYGWENIFPSITHSTKCIDHIAIASGHKPAELIIQSPSTAAEARQLLFADSFKTARCVLFGLTGVAAAVRIIDAETEAEDEYEDSVTDGREPLLSGVQERVIRFMGCQSVFTEFSVKRHGQHIVPIIEHGHISHGMHSDYLLFVKRMTHNQSYPSFWRVKDGHYGQLRSW